MQPRLCSCVRGSRSSGEPACSLPLYECQVNAPSNIRSWNLRYHTSAGNYAEKLCVKSCNSKVAEMVDTLPSGMFSQSRSTRSTCSLTILRYVATRYSFIKECVYIQINLFLFVRNFIPRNELRFNTRDELMRQIGVITTWRAFHNTIQVTSK